MAAEFFLQKSSPTYIATDNADVMTISHYMAQNLRQPQPIPPPPKHTFEISDGESVEIEKIVAAEKKVKLLYSLLHFKKARWRTLYESSPFIHLIT